MCVKLEKNELKILNNLFNKSFIFFVNKLFNNFKKKMKFWFSKENIKSEGFLKAR